MKFLRPIEPDHRIYTLPSKERFRAFIDERGVDAWNDFVSKRNARIRLEQSNPLKYGVELPMWLLADWVLGRISWEDFCNSKGCPANQQVPEEWKTKELREAFEGDGAKLLLILGGTGSTKTEYMLKRQLQDMIEYDDHESWVFHENGLSSINYHQKTIYKYMPKEWEKAGKSKVTYASFKVQTGFSNMSLVAPNASKMTFRSYEQELKAIESGKLGAANGKPSIGFIADELCPMSFLDTLRGRLPSRNAIAILGFTPLRGYSPTVRFFREGAVPILQRFETDISKPRLVPLVEVKTHKDGNNPPMKMAVVYFHSRYSPFANYEALRTNFSQDPDYTKLIRYDGYCESEKQELFPKFSHKIHTFKPEDLPAEGSNYMYVDPCGIHRNWFALWVRVDKYGNRWVYREWPCPNIHIPNFGCPGPWAEDGQDAKHKVGGVPALGSKSFGFGIPEYKNEFARLEGWYDLDRDIPILDCDSFNGSVENIEWRKIDSRFANVGGYAAEGNTTLIDECEKAKLYFSSTSGKRISEGIELINNALFYKIENGVMTQKPKLYISQECTNLLFAMATYTAEGGEKEATKDPMDVLRYMIVDDPPYISPNVTQDYSYDVFDKNTYFEPQNESLL